MLIEAHLAKLLPVTCLSSASASFEAGVIGATFRSAIWMLGLLVCVTGAGASRVVAVRSIRRVVSLTCLYS